MLCSGYPIRRLGRQTVRPGFQLVRELSVNRGVLSPMRNLDPAQLHLRQIMTRNHCHGYMAVSNFSCGGTVT